MPLVNELPAAACCWALDTIRACKVSPQICPGKQGIIAEHATENPRERNTP